MKLRRIAFAFVLAGATAPRTGAALRVLADPSDGAAGGMNGVGSYAVDTQTDASLGDGSGNDTGYRLLVKFPLASIPDPVPTTQLELFVEETRKDQYPAPGLIDGDAPFTNPGLGDLLILPVPDYDTLDAADYATAAIGPSIVLVAAGAEGPQPLAADVTDAVQQAVDASASFVAFRIQHTIETDHDQLNDLWFVWMTEHGVAAEAPALVVDTPEPDGEVEACAAIAAQLLLRRSKRGARVHSRRWRPARTR